MKTMKMQQLTSRIEYKPPLDWADLVGFLATRCIPGVESVIDGSYRRTVALAEAVQEGRIRLEPGADPECEAAKLLQLPGFGPWTVDYIGMRALSWRDAFPYNDYGVKKALPGRTPAQILDLAEAWRPWRAYATRCLWNTLG